MTEPRPVLPAELRRALVTAVGEEHVVTDPELLAGHEVDWTGRFRGVAPALVRPGSTEQVAAVLAACDRAGAPVVPQGGNTGLVGGGVPLHGEVLLSLRRLDALGPVDEMAAQVTAGAGTTLEALDRHVAPHRLAYAVDLAARGSATVGGTVATNAGGVHVLRWGTTRRQLAGIEAVTADGRVLSHLSGLEKDNTGYDLAGLLCGSEGTLAVITAARLALVPRHPERVVALCGFRDVATAVSATVAVRREVPALDAAELILADGLELVCRVLDLPPPFPALHRAYVLFEASAAEDPSPALADALGGRPGLGDVAVATDAARRASLWSYREEHTAAINTLGPPHKLDVTLPLGALARFVDEVPAVVARAAPGARCWLFGHVGDGNVHVNVTGLDPDDVAVDEAVLRLVVSRGGSISAEHGIGTAKRRWLGLQRSPAELEVFRSLRRALDPHGTLNPNVLV